ncbi:GTP-binding protein [Rudanella paleaurantiibacter]|uniref:GTP-binding protein n=1 Tax=Rudanella paleaurantiibacter TaxID=2614655 RepID=A0A7J5TTW7_9BACT|nr:GTP-binding protein [Rudanella paleaurantiibacter]KAB7727344.1 GTP-binding protein [Rudanella paleaurantiibacter]
MAKDVTILTGFLGSGKTTLLNALLNEQVGRRFALIENEFGEEGIDGELIVRPDIDITELSNGCLCCTLSNNLLDVLDALSQRQHSFDELIIETTGIADPSNIAVPFMMVPAVQEAFCIKRVICLVDAELVEDQLRDTEEAIGQISFADVILINKTDRVSPEYLTRLRTTLNEINPLAEVLVGHKEAYPIAELLAVVRDESETAGIARLTPTRPNLPGAYSTPTAQPQLAEAPPKAHHHRHSNLVSVSFRFTKSLDLTRLYHRLTTLLLFHGKDLYRIKGVIYDRSRAERWVVQSVGQTLTLVDGAPWQTDDERVSRLVFIGRGLKTAELETMLGQCFSKEPDAGSSDLLRQTPSL